MEPPNEFYIWQEFCSTRNFNRGIWDYFEVAIYGGRLVWRERARCKVCKKLVGWSGSSGNLKKHVLRYHSRVQDLDSPLPRIPSAEEFEYALGDEILRLTDGDKGPIRMFGDTYINGNIVRQRGPYPVWNYFFQKCLPNGTLIGKRYATCVVCGRDILWNGRGLESLRNHLHKIHLRGEREREETLEIVQKRYGRIDFYRGGQ